LTGQGASLTLAHLIYTFLDLDINDQPWDFPVELPDTLGEVFNSWKTIGLDYLEWQNTPNGTLSRLNASVFYPSGLDVCFSGKCFLKCSSMRITCTITPAKQVPVFNAIGRCQKCLFPPKCNNEENFDEIFPRKLGTLKVAPVIKAMEVFFVNDKSLLGANERYANVSITMDRSQAVSTTKNAYSLQCMGRTLNTTTPQNMWRNDSNSYETVFFGERGSTLPVLQYEDDLNNTRFTVPVPNYGNRRFLSCRVCVKRFLKDALCSAWYSKPTYLNFNIDDFSDSGERQKVIRSVYRPGGNVDAEISFRTYNPLVITLSNVTTAGVAVNVSFAGFKYNLDKDAQTVSNLLVDLDEEGQKPVSLSSLRSVISDVYELKFFKPGPHSIFWAGVFIVEVFVVLIRAQETDGTLQTFRGVMPQPMYRALLSSETSSFNTFNSGRHMCLSVSKIGITRRTNAIVNSDGSITCNTFQSKIALALRGNVTLGFSVPCSSDTHGARCMTCGLLDFFSCSNALRGPNSSDIYLFQVYGK
jgi:hypothetical protein